jgi:hypothetical protein
MLGFLIVILSYLDGLKHKTKEPSKIFNLEWEKSPKMSFCKESAENKMINDDAGITYFVIFYLFKSFTLKVPKCEILMSWIFMIFLSWSL